MNGASVLAYIRDICDQLDSGKAVIVARRAAMTLLVPAMLVPTACMMYGVTEYGAPYPYGEDDCANGIDDDYDGQIDCADPDCAGANELCLGCDDGQDNDGDGVADCDDPDCESVCS